MSDDWKEITPEQNPEWDRVDPIEGELVGVKVDVGPNDSKLYTLKTKDGKVSVWGSTVLDTKFEEIERGSMVKIVPGEKRKSEKSNRTYQDFTVYVKPPAYKEIGGEPLPDEPGDIPF